MISKTKYKSPEQLSSIMQPVDMEEFYLILEEMGLTISSEKEIKLKSGKSFRELEIVLL